MKTQTTQAFNKFNDWWIVYLASETEKARQRAERLFPTRVLSNKAKRDIFMDTFHWTMLEQRTTIEKMFEQQGAKP